MTTPSEPAEVSILLVSDPGLPSRRLTRILPELRKQLREIFVDEVTVHHRTELIRMHSNFDLDTESAQRLADEYDGVRATILLTEVPRHMSSRSVVAQVFPEPKVAVISCPALGIGGSKRLLKTIMSCVLRLEPAMLADARPRALAWTDWHERPDSQSSVLESPRVVGVPRLIAGMVIANEPWRTIPKLSSAFAAAIGVGAFGVFYSSIWQMADALSTARLVFIALTAVATMVLWLIVKNGLWDRPSRDKFASIMVYYNTSTIVTITLLVAAMYLALAVLILLVGLVVIAPTFMTQMIGEEARFTNYLDIAWLSAALGTVAGAIGSSFDSDTDLRKLTHGQRERQRVWTDEETSED